MSTPARFGTEFTVSIQSATTEATPSIARLRDGRAVVAWQDFGVNAGDIKFRILNGDGSPSSTEITANLGTAGLQSEPEVAALSDGRFVIAWTDYNSPGGDIRYRIFNPDGTAAMALDGIVGGSTTGNQQQPAVIGMPTGAFVIAWSDNNSTNANVLGGGTSTIQGAAVRQSGVSTLGPVRLSGKLGRRRRPGAHIHWRQADCGLERQQRSNAEPEWRGWPLLPDDAERAARNRISPTAASGSTRTRPFRESSDWPDCRAEQPEQSVRVRGSGRTAASRVLTAWTSMPVA